MAVIHGQCTCGKNTALLVRIVDSKVVRQCVQCWLIYDQRPPSWKIVK